VTLIPGREGIRRAHPIHDARRIFLTGPRPFADADIVSLWKKANEHKSKPPSHPELRLEQRAIMFELNNFRVPELAPKFQHRTVTPSKEHDQFVQEGMRFMLRHGPEIKLYGRRARSLEGRLLGKWKDEKVDPSKPFYKWQDEEALSGAINRYVERNWETARCDLARFGRHAGKIHGPDYDLETLGIGLTLERGALQKIVTEDAVIQLQALVTPDDVQWFVKTAFPV
jgi:hypothetical protein